MVNTLRLLGLFAHPDDESLGMGSTLARYAAEGVETYVISATRGERGWIGAPEAHPGLAALGQTREAELRAAAQVLGVREVRFLDYVDGELDQADPAEAIARIVAHLRRLRPHVVVTFAHDGAYGHPDHIAIAQFTQAAIVCAADPDYVPDPRYLPDGAPAAGQAASRAHRVAKLYYMVESAEQVAVYSSVFGPLNIVVDGEVRRLQTWEPWAITTRVDGDAYWRTAWQAIRCHASQAHEYAKMEPLVEAQHAALLGRLSYYRVFSLVNGGRQAETDLFEGLRETDG